MRPNWLASTASRLMSNQLATGRAKARMPYFPLTVPIPPERPATRSLGRLEPLRAPLFLAVTGGSFWAALGHGGPHRDWRAVFVAGLASSTYSTIVLSFGAPRIGRDARVDFIERASIWFGTRIIQPKPSKAAIISGIFMHQIADLAWATLFFDIAGARVRRLTSRKLAVLSVPWAVLTAYMEYYLILPWLQPLVPRGVPFWTGHSQSISFREHPTPSTLGSARPSPDDVRGARRGTVRPRRFWHPRHSGCTWPVGSRGRLAVRHGGA